MEFTKDIGGIDESEGNAVDTQIHGGIDGTQKIAGITNIFTSHVVEEANATQKNWLRLWWFLHQGLLLL